MNHIKHAMCAAALVAAGCQARDLTDEERDSVNDAIDRYAENVPLYTDLFEKMEGADVVPERKDLLDRDVLVEGLRNSGERLRELMDDGRVQVIIDKFETADQFNENSIDGARNVAKSTALAAAIHAADRREDNDQVRLRVFEREGGIVVDDEILIHEMGHHIGNQLHEDKWGYQQIRAADTREALFSDALSFGDVAYTLSGVSGLAWHMQVELSSGLYSVPEWKLLMSDESDPVQMRNLVETPINKLLEEHREQLIVGAVEDLFDSEEVFSIARQYGLEPQELATIYHDHYDDAFFRESLERTLENMKETARERLAGEPREARAEFRPPGQARK